MNLKKSKSRLLPYVIALGVVLMAFVVVKALPSGEKQVEKLGGGSVGTLVEVIYPELDDVEHSFSATGKLRATNRFEIFSQVNGQLLPSARFFKEGKSYQKGEVMLQIDPEEYEMTVLAQKSDFLRLITSILPDLKSDYPEVYPVWRQYVSDVDVSKSLKKLPESSSEQEKFYLSGKGVYSSFYKVQSAQEILYKYTIRAPFNGVVTGVNVEAGTAVRMGSPLGVLINTDNYDLEITVPLSLISKVGVGTSATLYSTEIAGNWSAKVIRIGGDIDVHSQSVKLFLRTSGRELKEGMFLTADIQQQPFENAMSLPRKMVDEKNRVFVVSNGMLQYQEVDVLSRQGEHAVVTGLPEGSAVLATVVKSAYPGMPVRIGQ